MSCVCEASLDLTLNLFALSCMHVCVYGREALLAAFLTLAAVAYTTSDLPVLKGVCKRPPGMNVHDDRLQQ
jgi:hypothetical protein